MQTEITRANYKQRPKSPTVGRLEWFGCTQLHNRTTRGYPLDPRVKRHWLQTSTVKTDDSFIGHFAFNWALIQKAGLSIASRKLATYESMIGNCRQITLPPHCLNPFHLSFSTIRNTSLSSSHRITHWHCLAIAALFLVLATEVAITGYTLPLLTSDFSQRPGKNWRPISSFWCRQILRQRCLNTIDHTMYKHNYIYF